MVVKADDPISPRVLRDSNLDSRTCSAEIIPSALVNENCVSTFEFKRINPRPVSESGAQSLGKPGSKVSLAIGHQRPTGIGEIDQIREMWLQRVGKVFPPKHHLHNHNLDASALQSVQH